jgi:hypothetical protein
MAVAVGSICDSGTAKLVTNNENPALSFGQDGVSRPSCWFTKPLFLGASNVSVRFISGEETGRALSCTNPASHKACRSALNSKSRYSGGFLQAALLNFSPRLIEFIG